MLGYNLKVSAVPMIQESFFFDSRFVIIFEHVGSGVGPVTNSESLQVINNRTAALLIMRGYKLGNFKSHCGWSSQLLNIFSRNREARWRTCVHIDSKSNYVLVQTAEVKIEDKHGHAAPVHLYNFS